MEHLLPHLAPFALCLFRLSGVFLFAPLLASTVIPGKVRILLCFMLALGIYPTLPDAWLRPVPDDALSLGMLVLSEVAVGCVIGFVAMLPIVSVQLAGLVMSQQMGMSLSPVFNPALETESEPFGELLLYTALAIFLSMGGLEALFLATAGTFWHIPLGGMGISTMPSDLVMGTFVAGFEVAIRVTMPLMALLLMETIASAFLMKTMPQLNIMSIGFAIKIIVGLLAMVMALGAVHLAIEGHVSQTGRDLLAWAMQDRGPGNTELVPADAR